VSQCHTNFGVILTKEGLIKTSDREQKNAAKSANHINYSFGETLACNCVLSKAYTREPARVFTGDRSEGPCYLSRNDHDRKIRARKQRTDIGKYRFVNRTINL